MCQILDPDLDMRERPRLHEPFIHVGFECQPLNVNVVTKRDKPLTPHVAFVIRALHRAKDLEDRLVFAHEQLARQLQVLHAARGERRGGSGGGRPGGGGGRGRGGRGRGGGGSRVTAQG